MTLKRYSKAIVAVVGAVGTWGAAALLDGAVDTPELFALLAALATAYGVYQVPNVSPFPVGDPYISEQDGPA